MFELCLELGVSHPDKLLRRLNLRQLEEWAAFGRKWGFGHRRADLRAAVQTAWIRSVLIESDPMSVSDFLVYGEEREPVSPEVAELLAGVRGMVADSVGGFGNA